MRRVVAILAAATGLAAMRAPAQEPPVDAGRLQLGVDSFIVYLVRGRDTARIGWARDELRLSGDSLVRLYHQVDTVFGELTDTNISRRADLRAVEHRIHVPVFQGRVTFGPSGVSGFLWAPRSDSVPVSLALPGAVYDAANFDLLVRAADLSDGRHFSSSAFNLMTWSMIPLEGVARDGTIRGREAWSFSGFNNGGSVIFWIDKSTRALMRSVMTLRPDMVMILVSVPRQP